MNDSVYKISLDIHEHASQAVLKAKKTDTGRKLHITLRAGGTPYTIANDCYAAFKATKPDGTVLFNACTIENNEIIYEFTEQTCSFVGRCKCEIALYGPDDKIITSPRFSLLVDGTIYPDEIVESTDEFSALTKLITDTLEATNDATQAAQKADQAANDANEVINKFGDHPIKLIDNTNGEVKTVLHELPEGAYILTGFFPYNREYDEEGIYFSNDLVSVEKYEAEDSVVVQFLVGRYLHSANISSNQVDYEKIPLRNLENKENRVPTIDENSDDEHYPTAKAVYDYVGQNGGSVPGDFPSFEKIEGVVEYNEIAKATEVSTVDELLAFDGNAILRDYRHEGSKVTENTTYDILKIPVQPGDVIRDMLGSYWKQPSNTSPWKYAFFYNASNTIIQNISIKYAFTGTSTSDTMVDYLDLRNNGLTTPDGASFVLLNLFVSYERLVNGSYVSTSTLQKCDIVTVNQPAELTYYDGTTVLEPYVPQDGPSESYYEAIDDVRIPRYEYALGDIETTLDSIIAIQESLIGGDTE